MSLIVSVLFSELRHLFKLEKLDNALYGIVHMYGVLEAMVSASDGNKSDHISVGKLPHRAGRHDFILHSLKYEDIICMIGIAVFENVRILKLTEKAGIDHYLSVKTDRDIPALKPFFYYRIAGPSAKPLVRGNRPRRQLQTAV